MARRDGERLFLFNRLLELFVGFFRATIVGYGGGPATIPLMEAEAVDNYSWLTKEEFANALAIGNTLPGPIATKIAGFVGYQVAGWPGALTALTATVAPTVLVMIGLYALLSRFSDSPVVKGMISGVRPVVWVLFVTLAIDYISFVRTPPTIIIAGLTFAAIYLFKLHPVIAVVFGLVAGGIFLRQA